MSSTPTDCAPGLWMLVEAHRARLLRMARRRTVCEQDAEDVVAEALTRAIECTHLDEARLPAWLTTVTLRLCVDVARGRTREQLRWARADIATVDSSCEQHVCDRAEAAWVAERVAALPSRQARALHLRAAGLDVAGIAQSLGVTYRTAESLLARGRATVRATLASTLVAAFLAAWRWLRGTIAQVSGGTVAAAAAVSAVSVVAVVTVVLGPSTPGAATPGPVVTSGATAGTPAAGSDSIVSPAPTSPVTSEVPARPDGPASATSLPLPAVVPTSAVPSVSPPVGVPRLPASLLTETPIPALVTPELPTTVATAVAAG